MNKISDRVNKVSSQIIKGKKLIQSIYGEENDNQSFEEIYQKLRKSQVNNLITLVENDTILIDQLKQTIIPSGTNLFILISSPGHYGTVLGTPGNIWDGHPIRKNLSYGGQISYGFMNILQDVKLDSFTCTSHPTNGSLHFSKLDFSDNENNIIYTLDSRGNSIEGFINKSPSTGDLFLEVTLPFGIGTKKVSFSGYGAEQNPTIYKETFLGFNIGNNTMVELAENEYIGNTQLGCAGHGWYAYDSGRGGRSTGGPGFAVLMW